MSRSKTIGTHPYRRTWPARLLGAVLRVLVVLLVTVSSLAASTAQAQAPEPNRAGLIIEYGDGTVDALCLTFPGETITGADLLQQSGLQVGLASGGMGTQVCQIGEVGCEPGREQCFCQCTGTSCAYWTYYYWNEGTWTYSPLGPALRDLSDGAVDAWVWGDGTTPPVTSPDAACAPAAQETEPAAETPTMTAQPEPTAAATPEPVTPAADGSGGGSLPCPASALVVIPLALLAALAWWRR